MDENGIRKIVHEVTEQIVHEQVAQEIDEGYDTLDSLKSRRGRIVEILRREYEPDRQLLYDFHATDATIAIQECAEIKLQRDALLVKLAKATVGMKEASKLLRGALGSALSARIVLGDALKEINDGTR